MKAELRAKVIPTKAYYCGICGHELFNIQLKEDIILLCPECLVADKMSLEDYKKSFESVC